MEKQDHSLSVQNLLLAIRGDDGALQGFSPEIQEMVRRAREVNRRRFEEVQGENTCPTQSDEA
jgi:hypothetical protein